MFRSASELIAKIVPEAIPEWKATDLELSEKTRRLLKEKELCQARGDFAGHRGVVAALLKVQDEMETNIFIAAPEEAEALRKSSFRIDQAIIGEYLNGTLTPESENLSGVGTRFQARLELIKNSESGSVEKISELGEWLAVAVAYVEILRAEGYEASACDLQHAVASLGDEADEAIDRWVASFSDLSEEERGVLSGDFKSVFEKAAEGGDAGFLFSLGERSLLAWKQDWSFARSLELVADDAETKMEVAGEYAGLGLRGAALRLIDQAHLQAQSLEVGPKVLRLYDLFELCLKAGDVDRAQETLRDLVDLGKNPEAPRGIVSLGALGEGILALQVGKAEEARKIFSSLQEKGGEVAPEIQSLASAYMKSMDQGEAARRNAQTLDVFSTVLAVRFEKLKSAGRT
ncbi:MAG: hypothetical protein K8R69_01360, partial [Deltaproteobacteria bacterium]|nr:hypothetical protein [Deltaproteobacteria bacterium]